MSDIDRLLALYDRPPALTIEFVGGPVDGTRVMVPDSALMSGWSVPVYESGALDFAAWVKADMPPARTFRVAHYRPIADASTNWLPQRLDDGTVRFRFWGLT